VAAASIDKNTTITNARANAMEKLIDAERQSRMAVDRARAEQYNRISAAQKEMAVYLAVMEAYGTNHRLAKFTKDLDTFEAVVKGNKVYVFSTGIEDSMSQFVVGKSNTVDSIGIIENRQEGGNKYE
jgi:regulator of protease activity HflC (stomatin/prohibitin superfamily)